MRILIYSYNYHPEPIGIAPLMTELAEGLVKAGHQVRVVTSMPNYPQRCIYDKYQGKWYQTEERNGVIIQRSYVWIRPKPGVVTRILLDGSFVVTSLIQAFQGWRPDVILLTVPSLAVSVPAALLGWLYNCPVLLNLQDILPEAAVQVGLIRNKLAIRIFEALEKFAYHTAHTITVISEGFVDNLVSKGIPKDKITCIPNWANVNVIRPLPKQGNSFRTAYHLDGKFVVLYSGNIALTQGLETVVKAATLVRHIPEIVFVIVGESKALQQLQQDCQTCKASNVKLLPFQPREKLPEMLAAADIGLVVQKRNVVSFNMPSKIQVLLACGRPIIASVPLNGTAARVVRQSGGGVVVPPQKPQVLASAIVELYENPEQGVSLGKQGRKFALKHFAYQNALNRYEALLTQITKKPNHNSLIELQQFSDL
ncbi:MAG: glycosyltransferase family 4 protein [Moorea sp. SIO3I7]|uniref:glycosyltransferase family 4 protein n=3 Tax=Moorena TaxID=1155738 RepID=UPI0013BEDC85|nr:MULTISPECIES: glycosyltransferase family 4 protein [unclassified Moorena]NEN96246.1 glycosyltransferase family 4 protein [Moorena sp. SIO3I7]NEO09255.1 glycosyltransferase family 4 protein [Moorena sp. SIO3I8]NEO18376.1 glycosyltransferase family 4 protein [Moorena sp. SIO4A5]NEQ60626.1 glycosyltransferase family 4 protein [Moorena sp. SIO4A1]